MARTNKDAANLADKIKQLKAEFQAYEAANTLVCAIQNWLDYMWGPAGNHGHLMSSFDRFPQVEDMTPDFVVRFNNGYGLIGEIMRTFRAGTEDGKQVLAYSYCDLGGTCHDVLMIVRSENDDVPCRELAAMPRASGEDGKAGSAVVVVGYYRDLDAVNGECLILKWRSQDGNNQFSRANVPAEPGGPDLNSEICDQSHCPLRIDEQVVGLKDRYPFTNDDPPPLYTAIQAVWPAVAALLTEDERDEMLVRGVVEKEVSVEDILGPELIEAGLTATHVRRAFSFLADVGLATRTNDDGQVRYRVHFQQPQGKSELDFFTNKEARLQLRLAKRARGPRTIRRRVRAASDQGMFDL